MKRIFLLWAALLLLCSCASQQESVVPTVPVITEPAVHTVPAGLFVSGSDAETDSGGALKVYPLGRTDCLGILNMGSDLLLFSGGDTTTLTKLSGNDLYIAATATLNCGVYPSDAAVHASASGVTYYDERRNQIVFLDDFLKEVKQVSLPDSLCGAPALSADLRNLYYCTTNALRCIDLETNLDRLLKEIPCSNLTLTALLCSDTVIACTAENSQCQLYINAATGQLLAERFDDIKIWTHDSLYLAIHQDGIYEELLIGDFEQAPALLTPYAYNPLVYPVMEMGGAVIVSENIPTDSMQLDYYDLLSGKCTASLKLKNRYGLYSFCNASNQALWFLRYDPQYECEALYRWDLEKTLVDHQTSRLSTRYTSDSPDLEGLAVCQRIADTLSEQYGVQILLWTDAVAFQPWDYTLISEHQVRVIQNQLLDLERFLSKYPPEFLKKAAENTSNGQIRICLVRSILGNSSAEESLDEVVGLQFWDQNGAAYLCLSATQDLLMQTACHEMFHIIDSFVVTECKVFDDWDSLNPKGFAYDYDYIANLSRDDPQWLDKENRAFIDSYSMSYPKEDRARIMEYAMMPGNEHYFQSETMQKKLRKLCTGIRQALRLEEFGEAFLWEQYLDDPLA